jgi:hypothetical protein
MRQPFLIISGITELIFTGFRMDGHTFQIDMLVQLEMKIGKASDNPHALPNHLKSANTPYLERL